MRHQPLLRRFLFFFDFSLIWLTAGVVKQVFRTGPLAVTPPASAKMFSSNAIGFVFLFSVLTVILAQSNGLYSSPCKKRLGRELFVLAESVVSAGIIAITALYLLGDNPRHVSLCGLTVASSWIPLAAWRKFIHSQSISGLSETRNVLILGCGHYGQLLRARLDQHPELGFVFKGYIDRRRGGRPPNPAHNIVEADILGPANELPAIVRKHFIDEIFISVPSDRSLVMEVAHYARSSGVPVRVMPDLYEGLAEGAPVEYLGPLPTLMLHSQPIPTVQLTLKRLVDIFLASTNLLILSPFLVLIAAMIKLDSAGPVFFASLRVGKKGRTFTCYKFRTMVENAEALKSALRNRNERDGVLFKIADDPRLTRIGKVLRKFSIDEIPQLWNVLRGDMSLVGPRPPIPSECEQYLPDHLRRLDVPPGLTGLWQVTARQNPSFQSYIELDSEYVNNWSFWLDCRILWKTIGVVLAGTGQ